MPYITEINADGDLNTALVNFAAICDANTAQLGLTEGDLLQIQDAAADFTTSWNASTAAKAAAHAAVEAKNEQKAESKAVISQWAKVFRANVAVSDTLLNQLMLPPHSTPGTDSEPATPTEPAVSANATGEVKLKWHRNGNISGTQFIIERQDSVGGPWTYLATATKTSLSTTWTPGQFVAYRVSAQRRGTTSAPCMPVSLWLPAEESVQLQIAA